MWKMERKYKNEKIREVDLNTVILPLPISSPFIENQYGIIITAAFDPYSSAGHAVKTRYANLPREELYERLG